MLAQRQGALLEVSQLKKNLMIDARTVHRYLDLLIDLMRVRRFQPQRGNVGKRPNRSPKLYTRDGGLTNALPGITMLDRLLSHPVAGYSREGFAFGNPA